ncbi:MAG: tRNA 4-thiouridine(8) synthase ThiI [Clostridiales bacterium]|jgi:thiamine biosynthesis protein ThiI|nr:tRNA 4-thiouridine(8) synthase ThiI [Clostridiales bacterium]
MKKVALVKYGEVALRGKNRRLHENKLAGAIKAKLPDGYWVKKEQGRLLIEKDGEDIDFEKVIRLIRHTTGVTGFCSCIQTDDMDIECLQKIALEYMLDNYGQRDKITFKVETRRADKSYPFTSQEISARVGGYVYDGAGNFVAEMRFPDVVLHVEIRNSAYVYAGTVKGVGGLPSGTNGKALLLLSGGIDSPVAGFLTAKRGVRLDAVYFDSPPFTSARAAEKTRDLAARLALYVENLRLYTAFFTPIQTYIYENTPPGKLNIMLKRAMLAVASKLGEKLKCHGLVVGDSLGQVSSQTMESILAINSAATLPVYRPLSGMDKAEITEMARRIETYEISIRPYEDCCTVFTDKNPETRPNAAAVSRVERRLADLPDLIEKAIESVAVTEYGRVSDGA